MSALRDAPAAEAVPGPVGPGSHTPAAAPARRRRARTRAVAVRLTSLAVVLVAWELYGRSVNPILFTAPSAIARAFVELTLSGELWSFASSSLQVMAIGVLAAVVVGIALGVLIARVPDVEHATELYINALYATPMVALVPILVLWFGFEVKAKVVVVFLFAVFPILINTQQGVKSVDGRLLEVARSFCSSEAQLWRD
ncbi:MAG TPA: ABC transporter permease subunit, partial [Chloroflexota bacterium]